MIQIIHHTYTKYDELFESYEKEYEFQNITDKSEITNILKLYMEKYFTIEDKEQWFNGMKDLCDELGYASDMKVYKENPEAFKGNVADVSMVLRVALTSKSMTPDLYEIMKNLGKERILKRYQQF